MAVPTNFVWRDVSERRDHGLGGGGALSLIHAPGMQVSMARCDESNAFSSVELPDWMWPWMATPAVPAAAVWELLPSALQSELDEWTLVCPCYTRLPMGLSHAVHILMAINVEAVGRALVCSGSLAEESLRSTERVSHSPFFTW